MTEQMPPTPPGPPTQPPTPPPSPPAMPPRPAKKGMNKNAILIIVGIVALLVIIGAVVGALSGDNSKDSGEKASTTTTKTEKEREEKSTYTPKESVDTGEPAYTPPAPKTWQNVFNMSASSNKKSETFEITSTKQQILYSVTGDPSWTMCVIYIYSFPGEYPEEMIMVDAPGSDQSALYLSPGTYYVELDPANCTVEVTIQEFK